MNFFKKLFNIKDSSDTKKESLHETNLNVTVTKSSYYTKPKKISYKNVYTNDDIFYIRRNIIHSRKEIKMTQKELSEKLGYSSTSFISKIERGDAQQLKHEDVKKISSCLNVDIDKLLQGEEKIQ